MKRSRQSLLLHLISSEKCDKRGKGLGSVLAARDNFYLDNVVDNVVPVWCLALLLITPFVMLGISMVRFFVILLLLIP